MVEFMRTVHRVVNTDHAQFAKLGQGSNHVEYYALLRRAVEVQIVQCRDVYQVVG